MSSHLVVSETRRECEGCAAIIRPGIVAMTGDVIGGRLVAQCPECLKSLDPLLAAAWSMVPAWGGLSALRRRLEALRTGPAWPGDS